MLVIADDDFRLYLTPIVQGTGNTHDTTSQDDWHLQLTPTQEMAESNPDAQSQPSSPMDDGETFECRYS